MRPQFFSFPSRNLFLDLTKARIGNPAVERWFHQPSIRSQPQTTIRLSNSPPVQGGKALNQKLDPTCGTRVPPELPCMGALCAHEAVVRSIQYNFTASLRAMATLATFAPRRNFNR